MVLAPEIPPRSKPVEAMVDCGELPQLPIVVVGMDTEEALRVLLETKINGDAVFHECAARHNGLVDWINEE